MAQGELPEPSTCGRVQEIRLIRVQTGGLQASWARGNMAHIRQSRPNSGFRFQIKVLKLFPIRSRADGGIESILEALNRPEDNSGAIRWSL